MSTVPIELPLKASEAAALADLIFQHLDARNLTDDIRNRLGARLPSLGLTNIQPFIGSLQKDPVHSSTYYIVVDAQSQQGPRPFLLHIALASSPASGLFPDAILIGRMRPGGGREIVVNAIPFGPNDHYNVRVFAEQIDRGFLPRPQAKQTLVVVGSADPEAGIPAAFEGFRQVQRTYGVNLACPVQISADAGADSLSNAFHLGLWSAIRAGWRDGYGAELSLSLHATNAESLAATRSMIRTAAGFTRFALQLGSASDVEAAEAIYDEVRAVRAQQESWKHFDFELSFAKPSGTQDATSVLERFRTQGRALTSYGGTNLEEILPAAKTFGLTPSIQLAPGFSLKSVQEMARLSGGRLQVKIPAQGSPKNERSRVLGAIETVAQALRA